MMTTELSLGGIVEEATGKTWSALDLDVAINRSAGVLSEHGVGRGDTVLVYHGGSGNFFADLFAVWRRGACAACLNPGLTKPELHNISAFLQPRLILIGDGGDAGCLEGGPELVCAAATPAGPDAGALGASHLDDPALILFTSGTTGTPKGVVHTFRSLLARIALNRQFIGDAGMHRTLCVLPTHFGHGLIGNCLTPLMAGRDLVIGPGSDIRTASRLGEIIDDFDISFMSSVPAFWKLAVRLSKPPSNGSLRRVHVGSAPISADLWQTIIEWAGTRDVVNMYGITETANWLAGASAAEFDPEDGLIGRMWGGQAAVLREDGRISAHGEGELLVQSPSLMSGYYQLDEQTAAVLRDGWFYTGDVGRIDPDGSMRLTGRRKNEINRGGIKIHPEDIDILLERHPQVREACAFGYDDDIAGQSVGVAVCLAEGDRPDLGELRSWCAERLAQEKNPDRWFVVDDIPKTDRGKINRQVVADFCLAEGKN